MVFSRQEYWSEVPLLTPTECSESCSVVSDFFRPHRLYSLWNSPGQNTGVGSLSFLQGIFPTQGSNTGLPQCRQILYQLSHKGSPTEVKHQSPNMMRENVVNRPCVSLTPNMIAQLLTGKKEELGEDNKDRAEHEPL